MRGKHSAIAIIALVAVLALTSVGVAAKAFPTRYTGVTSQGHPMSLVVGPTGRAVTVDMKYHYTCSPSNSVIASGDKWRVYLASTRKFRDAWSSDQPQDIPDWPDLGAGDLKAVFKGSASGQLGRTKAIGTYHEHVTILDATGAPSQQCDTGTVRFSLKPAKK
jgi:hypothetical protein